MQRLILLAIIGLVFTSCGKEPHGTYKGSIDNDLYELDFRTSGELYVTEADRIERHVAKTFLGDAASVGTNWVGSWRIEDRRIKTYKNKTFWKSFEFDLDDLIEMESRVRFSRL